MAIKKLQEFARDGQKNTDNLSLTDGFSVTRKPARQWFNYLFNMLSLKINELVDLDPIARSDIINDLINNDSKKPLSAAMGKKLQDEKLDASKRGAVSGVASLDENKKVPITELHEASTTQKGITQLVNNLTTGGIDKALTAEQGKLFYNMFVGSKSSYGYQPMAGGLIFQWCEISLPAFTGAEGNSSTSFTFPTAFPNRVLMSASFIKNVGKKSNWGDVSTWVTNENQTSATVVIASKTLVDLSGLPRAKVFLIGY